MFLLQTVMAHHGVHITLGHGFFSCHTSFQIDGKTNHCNTVLDMGKLQIFDLCLALDTLQINDRLFAFLDCDAGILFHSLVKSVAERCFFDDEGYRSMDGANCGCGIFIRSKCKTFFF